MVEPVYNKHFGDYEAEVEPFTKSNWKTARSRDNWNDIFQKMDRAKHEAEWRSVLDDDTDRKAAIIHVNNYNREKWLRRVGEYDLCYRDIRFSQPYDGFSHQHRPADPNDPERLTYAVIAENPDIADKMEEAENEMEGQERHDTVGELLGFPDCCRDFFNEDWVTSGIKDPMYEISCNSGNAEMIDDNPGHIRINDPNPGACVLWRYFGISFITHMPCSWDCEESIEIARQRYRVMAENGFEEAADAINAWMDQPFTWSAYHGIAHIQNTHVTASTNSSNYLDEKKIVWKGEYPIQES